MGAPGDGTMGQAPEGSGYNEDGIGRVFYQGRAEFGFPFPLRRLFSPSSQNEWRQKAVCL
jgi:type I restriction enzyme S subunit